MDTVFDFESRRERIARQFDDAVWPPESGMKLEELNRELRRIAEAGDAEGAPLPLIRARLLAFALANIRCAVNDFDPFAAILERQRLNGTHPSTIHMLREERRHRLGSERIPPQRHDTGFYISQVDVSHTCPDWEAVLHLGVPGLLARARERFQEAPSPFSEAVATVYTAFRGFLLRYAAVAESSARADLAEMLRFLADHAPETLRQALQLGLLYREIQELEGEWVRSMGIFDRLYAPFYEADLAAGRLTEAAAGELLTCYFARFQAQSGGLDAGTPFTFGGWLPGGETRDGCNVLTRLAWKILRRLGYVDPKFQLRVNPATPEDLLLQIAECIKEGKNATCFCNETVARRMFLKHGKSPEDLSEYVLIGCYEPAIMGRELSCTMTTIFNLAKPAELLFADPAFAPETFTDVETRYFSLLREGLAAALEQTRRWETLWPEINPAPFLSGTMADCMASGRDVSEAGTRYAASGVMCAGIGTAADTLAAIRHLVFEEKLVGFAELGGILRGNWSGAEELRLEAANRAPKWGCGDDRADEIAVRIAQAAAGQIDRTPNAKGGFYQMGLWSIDWSVTFGCATKATADGRFDGATLSKNSDSTIGCDREGIAGLIASVTKLDHADFADGAVLDVMLLPKSVAGDEGTRFIVSLLKTFFAQGGLSIQFNVVSPETLRDAQLHPERYQHLQVRLCGWNVRFVDLAKPHQDCLIREAESKEEP